jgi:hypothetical protein
MATLGSFNPTTWVSGSAPGISAAQLQRLEDQIDLLDRPWSAQTETFDRDLVLDSITWHRNGGVVKVAAQLSPAVADNWNLGTAALPWQNLYVDYIADRNNALKFSFGTANETRSWQNFVPVATNAVDLGLPARYWRTLHYANLSQHSDERDKSYMAPVDVPIAALRDLHPIRFQRDGDDERVSLGFGAQTLDVWVDDWLPVGPDYSMVTEPTPDTDERWGMDGTQLIPAMVGWMQELLERVEALEAG